jgi:hypothetical protein
VFGLRALLIFSCCSVMLLAENGSHSGGSRDEREPLPEARSCQEELRDCRQELRKLKYACHALCQYRGKSAAGFFVTPQNSMVYSQGEGLDLAFEGLRNKCAALAASKRKEVYQLSPLQIPGSYALELNTTNNCTRL